MKTNLVLIGPPGSGKTTLARQITDIDARFTCFDTDKEISSRSGMSIPQIFAQYGESYFRKLETDMVEVAARRTHTVIATGGGAVTVARNMTALQETGIIIYLRCSAETLCERTRGESNRPLLAAAYGEANGDARRIEHLNAMLAVRGPLYLQYCDHIIDADACDIWQTAEKILRMKGKENADRRNPRA